MSDLIKSFPSKTPIGKSESLLKGEIATLVRANTFIENKYIALQGEFRLVSRKCDYLTRVARGDAARVETLESDKTVLKFFLICGLLISNLITFGVMR